MLSKPTFDDHSLSESFYQTLINLFYESLSLSTQSLLGECSFGFAPDSLGVKTFFIIAPSILDADRLIQDIDSLKNRVMSLMGGVGKLAICVNPLKETEEINSQNHEEETFGDCLDQTQEFLPQYMMCKIFPIDLSNQNLD
ncbi:MULTISPECIES: hypothetical protein [Okeania]|uniref:Uncharacterized protein n=1 Tax=Okeania hirsuta TaxID=1458930 RepID=A0A3N6NNJ6_9CYAN|nr:MULTISPECIES: hypothetical protein [Okeania]NES79204.1 hypothetical protein [Okeania sp. SIO1H4]NET18411.1 hypothetical protein [Okeania sp. SIO1H5]NET77685.1 hypothetical protein [Okeania sp. SIO1F9]NET96376.1 hypothetical protein [Okeania sp. SIO1H2]RQH18881.1 hypothetical protein D4Z78_14875 [Okeania hirsuta]